MQQLTPRPTTTFDTPQCTLLPDTHARHYANVVNLLQWVDYQGNGKEYTVVVPTWLFPFMRDVLKLDPSEQVFMYIAQQGKYFVFGLAYGEQEYIDLWAYTVQTLPGCFTVS
jgi:hypothetical protein